VMHVAVVALGGNAERKDQSMVLVEGAPHESVYEMHQHGMAHQGFGEVVGRPAPAADQRALETLRLKARRVLKLLLEGLPRLIGGCRLHGTIARGGARQVVTEPPRLLADHRSPLGPEHDLKLPRAVIEGAAAAGVEAVAGNDAVVELLLGEAAFAAQDLEQLAGAGRQLFEAAPGRDAR